MSDLTNISDKDIVLEIYRRINGETEMHWLFLMMNKAVFGSNA